jgi:hypothetical protein
MQENTNASVTEYRVIESDHTQAKTPTAATVSKSFPFSGNLISNPSLCHSDAHDLVHVA